MPLTDRAKELSTFVTPDNFLQNKVWSMKCSSHNNWQLCMSCAYRHKYFFSEVIAYMRP